MSRRFSGARFPGTTRRQHHQAVLEAPTSLKSLPGQIRLERLDHALSKWNAKGAHAATIAVLRQRMDDICGRIPQADAAHATCRDFLAKT